MRHTWEVIGRGSEESYGEVIGRDSEETYGECVRKG